MKRNQILMAAISAAVISSASTCMAAQANPFTDVPKDHWAYDAVTQLVHDGVIEGYGDSTFKGDHVITRYEMAQMVAKAMAHKDTASGTDKATIDKLSAEFADELNSLGVRVANLERNADNVQWSGSFAQKYMKKYQTYHKVNDHIVRNPSGGPWYEKEFDLNISAKIPGADGWTAHSSIVTKWGSSGEGVDSDGKDHGRGFNDERDLPDEWNGGNSRSNENRLDKVWVEGNLGKTGQYMKFGDFQPWTMNGLVNDANIKGASLEHWGKNFATHIYAGRLDVKDWDVGMYVQPDYANGYSDSTNNWAWTANGIQPYTDFVRKHDTNKFTCDSNGKWHGANSGTDFGGDNDYDAVNWKIAPHRKDVFAFVYDQTFSKTFNASVGYYRYKSAAYHEDPLNIGAIVTNYKLVRNLNLEGMYSMGDKGGNNKAWNVELQFRGNPWIPANRNHLFGAYLGYRHLGPDAIIKTNFGDGCSAGQKGWEIGMFYNIMKNCQYTLKYYKGNSLTYNNDRRSKIFTTLSFNF
jgi:hypothetical protein